jgi:hypothetical protein
MDKATATLIGILFTDGCLSPKGKSSWRFYFSNKSERLMSIFQDCITQIFGSTIHISLGFTQDGLYRATVDSKTGGELFTRRFGTFRTLKYHTGEQTNAHLPIKELLKHKVASDFLKAAFSCDGGVNLYVARRKGIQGETLWLIRGVYLACAHPVLRKEYCHLLKALGINARNVEKDGKVKIETEKDIRTFYQNVGFIEGVHITHTSKFWPEIEKQKLLEKVVHSYDDPKSVYTLQQFIK